jgi:hypothetical protein
MAMLGAHTPTRLFISAIRKDTLNMATPVNHNSAPNTVTPESAKRFWQNPRWLLLLPLAAVVGTSAFLIVRRRKSSAAS